MKADEQHTAAVERLRALCVEAGIAVSIAGYLRASDLARLLGVGARTLRAWRHDGCGPRATLIGNQFWYALTAVAEYLARQEAAESGRTGIDAAADAAEDGANPPHRKAQ